MNEESLPADNKGSLSNNKESMQNKVGPTRSTEVLAQTDGLLTKSKDTLSQSIDVLTQKTGVLTQSGDALTQSGDTLTQDRDVLTQSTGVLTQSKDALIQPGGEMTQSGDVLTQSGSALTQSTGVLMQPGDALTQNSGALMQGNDVSTLIKEDQIAENEALPGSSKQIEQEKSTRRQEIPQQKTQKQLKSPKMKACKDTTLQKKPKTGKMAPKSEESILKSQRESECLLKYHEIKASIPKDKSRRRQYREAFKQLARQYPDVPFPGSKAFRTNLTAEELRRENIAGKLNELFLSELKKKCLTDFFPLSAARVMLTFERYGDSPAERLIKASKLSERTFQRAIRELIHLGFVRSILFSQYHRYIFTDKAKEFMKSIE